MSNQKISQFTSVSTLADDDEIPLVRAARNARASLSVLLEYIEEGIPALATGDVYINITGAARTFEEGDFRKFINRTNGSTAWNDILPTTSPMPPKWKITLTNSNSGLGTITLEDASAGIIADGNTTNVLYVQQGVTWTIVSVGDGIYIATRSRQSAASTNYYIETTQTWTVPTWVAPTTVLHFHLYGGGAGGEQDNAGDLEFAGAGGSGGYCYKRVTGLTAGQTISWTIGAGGDGGDGAITTGQDGGDTIAVLPSPVSLTLTASGGTAWHVTGYGPPGGATNGDINVGGEYGTDLALTNQVGTYVCSGGAGPGPLGGGGGNSGGAGNQFGAGGGGAANGGGDGANGYGLVVVEH